MTVPSPTDKVVDIHARAGAVRNEASPLLSNIRARGLKRLTALAGEVLDKADDTLFDFVQRADGSVSNQDYFEAMRELRKQKPVIEQRYAEHLTAAFVALERGNPLEVDLERSLSESRELSLVSEDQLEEQLGTSMIAAALTRHLGPILGQLNYRLGIVAGIDELNDMTNPLGPAHIAYAFRYAMQPCEVSTRIKVLLFKLYEREMNTGLAALYNEINRLLVEAGIAPEIKPTYARTPRVVRAPGSNVAEPVGGTPDVGGGSSFQSDAEPGSHAAAPMHSGYGPAGHVAGPHGAAATYVPTPETAAERTIFASLHELLSGYRRIQEQQLAGMAPGAPHVGPLPATEPGPQMSANEVLSVLSLFQSEMPDGLRAAIRDPSASITQHLKQELLKGAERLGLDPGSRMTMADEDSVDLVGMLFDVLLDERDFNSDSRQLISRLIVPFVKVAMLDRRMFLQKTHPARRLLNALAEACEGNAGEAPQERELMARAERTIDRLVAEFNEDIAIFEALEQEFREFIEQHRRRAALAEKRATEAQRGKERLDRARSDALDKLREMLERHTGLPPGIEAFLRRYWTHHLTLCALRDEGDGNNKQAEALAVGEELATLSTLDDPLDRAARLEGLRPQLEPILVSAGSAGNAARDVLQSLHQALASGGEDPDVREEVVTALERNAPQVGAVVLAEVAAPVVEEEPPESLDYDEADADKVRKLQVGAWVQFTEDDGTSLPAKLSWISPISNRMLFVNRRGLRYCVASPEELAAMMGEGKLSLRPHDAAFEHAMTQVLGKLRSSTSSASTRDVG